MKYELAGAYRKNGNETKALDLYAEIKEQDPGFKNINSKMENMKFTNKKSEKSEKPETKPKPKKKKNRVSYI